MPLAVSLFHTGVSRVQLPRQRQQNEGRQLDRVEREKKKLEEVESEASRPQSLPCSTKGAKARGKQNEVKRQRGKDTTPCHFGPRRRLQHLANVCKLHFDTPFVRASTCLDMSVIDHAYVMRPACARLTLHMRTPSNTMFWEALQVSPLPLPRHGMGLKQGRRSQHTV